MTLHTSTLALPVEGGGEGEGKGSKAQGDEGKSENCMALPAALRLDRMPC